jgi:hypothetical protein
MVHTMAELEKREFFEFFPTVISGICVYFAWPAEPCCALQVKLTMI